MKAAREHERAAVTVLAAAAEVRAASGHEPEVGLGELWTRLEPAITARGGVITHRDDHAIEAEFSSLDGTAGSDDAASAVEAALEMLRENHTVGPEAALWFAAHRGPAHSLDDVRLAAATLREQALPGQVLVTEAVYRRARGLLDVQAMDPDVGLGQGIFRVWGMRPRPARYARNIGATLLVGRDAELAFLHGAFQQVVEGGSSRIITVTGPAGMGKSRLVNEFLRRLDAQGQPYLLFRGRADPTAAVRPHALLRDLLAFRFKILESDPPEIARAKLVGGVQDWLGPDAVEVAHWMGQFAGFDFSSSPYLRDRLDDTGRARLTALAMMRKFLSAVAAHTPVLIVLDNVQWADDGSLDGLEALARVSPTGPILVVALARPELLDRRRSWANTDTAAGASARCMIALGPLQHHEAAAMASQTLRSALSARQDVSPEAGAQRSTADIITLPTRLIDRIVEASGGNPYFVEELVKNYIETGILMLEGEAGEIAWRIDMARLTTSAPPGSLDEALRAHLDVLSPLEHAVIHRAAVVGQVFWEDAVRMLLKLPDTEVEAGGPALAGERAGPSAALQTLLERGLILRRDISVISGEAEYLFRNPQLQAVVYASVPPDLRARWHVLIGDWLAERHAGHQDVHAAAIARHYDLGSAMEQAANWYTRAGLMARTITAPEAAARFFLRALETLPANEANLARRVALHNHLWDVQWWQAQYGAALATARDLLAEAEAHNDIAAQAAAWNRMAAVHNRMGEPKQALQSVQRAERLARQGGANGEVVKALFNRGVTLDQLGHAAEALEAGQQALAFNQALMERGVDSEAIHEAARILALMGSIHQRSGRYDRAGENFQRLLEIARAREDTPGILSSLMRLGENHLLRGDHESAAEAYRDALEMARAGLFHDLEIACMDALAGARAAMGDYQQAEEDLREVERLAGSQDWSLLPDFYRHRAVARLGLNRVADALADGVRAVEVSSSTHIGMKEGATEQAGRAWRVLGQVLARLGPSAETSVRGKPCDVHACFAASMQAFVELGMPGEQARTLRDWAAFELEQGDHFEGLRMWKEARDTFASLGMKAEVERMEKGGVH